MIFILFILGVGILFLLIDSIVNLISSMLGFSDMGYLWSDIPTMVAIYICEFGKNY